jgi:hypothetical protein
MGTAIELHFLAGFRSTFRRNLRIHTLFVHAVLTGFACLAAFAAIFAICSQIHACIIAAFHAIITFITRIFWGIFFLFRALTIHALAITAILFRRTIARVIIRLRYYDHKPIIATCLQKQSGNPCNKHMIPFHRQYLSAIQSSSPEQSKETVFKIKWEIDPTHSTLLSIKSSMTGKYS